MKSWVITGALILVVTALVLGVLGNRSPAPGRPESHPALSDVIPASQGNEAAGAAATVSQPPPGEIEKKPRASFPERGPKEAPGGAAQQPAESGKPAPPPQGVARGFQAGEANPVPVKPVEPASRPAGAPMNVEPTASKSAVPDQIPGLGLLIRDTDAVPAKPAETTVPPAAAPAKEAPPPVMAGQWVPLDQVDVQPQLTRSVNAVYPPELMRRKIESQLRFSILISENGDVLKADLLQASTDRPAFEAAARTALLKRKYSPALKGGVAVQVSLPININFKLNR